jgi:hypothetical protein
MDQREDLHTAKLTPTGRTIPKDAIRIGHHKLSSAPSAILGRPLGSMGPDDYTPLEQQLLSTLADAADAPYTEVAAKLQEGASIAELTASFNGDHKRILLTILDTTIIRSPLPNATQVAVALLAATLAVRRVMAEGAQGSRGKLINAAIDDFRRMLQRELPL